MLQHLEDHIKIAILGQSEPVVLVSSGTFECPLENDDTLLLSTLQGQVPHANGLYYFGSENNRRKAIK